MAKLSFTTMGTPEMTGVEAIQAARKYGFDAVDLRVSDHKGEITADTPKEDLRLLRGCLLSEGIELAGLLCYNVVGTEETSSWQAMTASLKLHMEIGLKMGSPAIRMFGGNPHKEVPFNTFLQKSADSIRIALEAFDREPIEIVLQNHGGSYNAIEGVQLINAVGRDDFGLTFSPDHCVMMGEDMQEVYKQVPSVTKQLYASDVIMKPEGGYQGILPGQGDVPLKEAYQAIGGDDFKGYVSFKWEKIWQDHLEEPEIALPYFIEYWR